MGALPGQRRGDRRADAACGAGDQCGASGEGEVPVVGGGDRGVGRLDLDHLAADVGGGGGEEEAQSGLGGVGVGVPEPDEVDRPAPSDLLAERARETLQRLLGGGLVVVGGVERGAEHDHPAARGDGPYDGVERGVHFGERVDVPDAGGVEDDGGGASGVVRAEARAGEYGGEVEIRLARGEVQQAAGE